MMDVVGMGEGDRVGVRVAHGWDADTSIPLVILQIRTDAGAVGLVSPSPDLAQTLVDQGAQPSRSFAAKLTSAVSGDVRLVSSVAENRRFK